MPQLRDAKTSELIAEGPPDELVVIALELGEREVIYDGVGDHFDPEAVRKHTADRLEHLPAKDKAALKKRHDDARTKGAKGAQAALEGARARIG